MVILVSVICDWVEYHVMCLRHDISVRQHSKSEHWAPCPIHTLPRYDWIKPKQTNKNFASCYLLGKQIPGLKKSLDNTKCYDLMSTTSAFTVLFLHKNVYCRAEMIILSITSLRANSAENKKTDIFPIFLRKQALTFWAISNCLLK